jgi:hypothetical protein
LPFFVVSLHLSSHLFSFLWCFLLHVFCKQLCIIQPWIDIGVSRMDDFEVEEQDDVYEYM